MLQRLEWVLIVFVWILHVSAIVVNGLPLNGTVSYDITPENSTNTFFSSLKSYISLSEIQSNVSSSRSSFFRPNWLVPNPVKTSQLANFALLPVLAIVIFITMVSLRCCTWQREDQKFKDRGCSYDVTNYVILTQEDPEYSDVDIRSDTISNYDTVTSFTSYVPKSPWRNHGAMPSYVSLQRRIDSQYYDTTTSYHSFLQSPRGKKAFSFEKQDLENAERCVKKQITSALKPRKIPGTRFSIVPALDNYVRLKRTGFVRSPSQPASPRLVRNISDDSGSPKLTRDTSQETNSSKYTRDTSQDDTVSTSGSDVIIPRRNGKNRVSFTEKSRNCELVLKPQNHKMVDAQTQTDNVRKKKLNREKAIDSDAIPFHDNIKLLNLAENDIIIEKDSRTKLDCNCSISTINGFVIPELHRNGNIAKQNQTVLIQAEIHSTNSVEGGEICTEDCARLHEYEKNKFILNPTERKDDIYVSDSSSEANPNISANSVMTSNKSSEKITINITTNPCDDPTPPTSDERVDIIVGSSVFCCSNIPPKTKSETDLLKNNNNDSKTENFYRRKSFDVHRSIGKINHAKISPINPQQAKCFCDNGRKYSLGAITVVNDSSLMFKTNMGNSFSSLKDMFNSASRRFRGANYNNFTYTDTLQPPTVV